MKAKGWFFVIAIAALLIPRLALAHDGYHYSGVSNTAPTAASTSATITQWNSVNCAYGHIIGWAVLWDNGVSNQYLEAGVGSFSWAGLKTPKGFADLWYATAANNSGAATVVGRVKLGTSVKISIVKNSNETATAVWSWTECKGKNCSLKTIMRTLGMPGWTDRDGIHPTKFEAYAYGECHPAACFDFNNVAINEDDYYAFLQETDPYYLLPDSTLQNFSLRYGSCQ